MSKNNFDSKYSATKKPLYFALTGASGFIGNVLLHQLLANGYRVRILTREPEKWSVTHGLDIYCGDLINTHDWTDFLNGIDIVIHAAAELHRHDLMMSVNVTGSERLLNAAIISGVKRWVQLSSVGAYGSAIEGFIDENSPENPHGNYEVTKTLFDQFLKNIAKQSSLEYCILRPSNVYGSKMTNQSLYQMIEMIRRGWFAFIGPVGASANYVHVNDVVDAIILCAQLPQAANRVFNVSDWTTIEKMAEAIANGLGVSVPTRRFNLHSMLLVANLFGWIPRFPLTIGRVSALSSKVSYSTGLIEKELGWRVKLPISLGINDLIRK